MNDESECEQHCKEPKPENFVEQANCRILTATPASLSLIDDSYLAIEDRQRLNYLKQSRFVWHILLVDCRTMLDSYWELKYSLSFATEKAVCNPTVYKCDIVLPSSYKTCSGSTLISDKELDELGACDNPPDRELLQLARTALQLVRMESGDEGSKQRLIKTLQKNRQIK